MSSSTGVRCLTRRQARDTQLSGTAAEPRRTDNLGESQPRKTAAAMVIATNFMVSTILAQGGRWPTSHFFGREWSLKHAVDAVISHPGQAAAAFHREPIELAAGGDADERRGRNQHTSAAN